MCPYFLYKCHTRDIYAERCVKCIVSHNLNNFSTVRNMSYHENACPHFCMEQNMPGFSFLKKMHWEIIEGRQVCIWKQASIENWERKVISDDLSHFSWSSQWKIREKVTEMSILCTCFSINPFLHEPHCTESPQKGVGWPIIVL